MYLKEVDVSTFVEMLKSPDKANHDLAYSIIWGSKPPYSGKPPSKGTIKRIKINKILKNLKQQGYEWHRIYQRFIKYHDNYKERYS